MMRDALSRKEQTYGRTRLTFGSGTPSNVKDTSYSRKVAGRTDASSPATFSRVEFGSDSDGGESDTERTNCHARRFDVWNELAASTGAASRASSKRSARQDSLESAVSPHPGWYPSANDGTRGRLTGGRG